MGKQKKVRAKPQKKQKKDKSLIALYILAGVLTLGLAVFGVVMAVRAIYQSYLDSGSKYRNDVILRTEHYELNGAMLSYRFYDAYYSGSFNDGYDDPDKLRSVASPADGMTLFEYDAQLTILSMASTMRYAEAATKNGYALSEKDEQFIENRIEGLKIEATNSGVQLDEYLSARYGRGVNADDVRALLKLEKMAEKQYTADEIGVRVSEEEIDAYLATADLSGYQRIDFYIVNLTGGVKDSDDEITKAQKRQNAFDKAARLAQCTSLEEFRALALTYLKEDYADDATITAEEIENILNVDDHLVGRQILKVAEDDPASSKWLYDPARKTGDAYAETTEPAVYYIDRAAYSIDAPNDAYLVLSLRYDNYPTRSAALAALNGIVEEYEQGARTEEAFRALVKKYDQNAVSAYKEGYYDNTAAASSFNTLLDNLKSSVEGGTVVGQVYEVYGQTGLYYVYYLGKAGMRTRIEAREALIGRKCDELYAQIVESVALDFDDADGERVAPLNR